MELTRLLPKEILDLYEVHNYRHAAEVLRTSRPAEFDELCEALAQFRLTKADIATPGGNESTIPKKISSLLRPKGWFET